MHALALPAPPPPPRPLFELTLDDLEVPLLAVVLHQGTELSPDVAEAIAIDDAARCRVEDRCCVAWATLSPNRAVVLRSRFEVDLDRPAHTAVYLGPQDAEGRSCAWRAGQPPPSIVARSLEAHAGFYRTMHSAIDELLARHHRALVLDVHCRRREGAPDIEVGAFDGHEEVRGAFEEFRAAVRAPEAALCRDRAPRAGHFASWVHRTFPHRACAISVTVRNTFVDPETGCVDLGALWAWREVLGAGTRAGLAAIGGGEVRSSLRA